MPLRFTSASREKAAAHCLNMKIIAVFPAVCKAYGGKHEGDVAKLPVKTPKKCPEIQRAFRAFDLTQIPYTLQSLGFR